MKYWKETKKLALITHRNLYQKIVGELYDLRSLGKEQMLEDEKDPSEFKRWNSIEIQKYEKFSDTLQLKIDEIEKEDELKSIQAA